MFCDNLKEYRKQKGYSQTQLGDRIGVTRQAISRWESGADTPSLERIAALARVLGVTIDALAGMPATLAPDDGVRVDRFAHMIDVPVLSREVVACCGSGIGAFNITNASEPGIQIPRSKLHRFDDMHPPYAIYADGDCLESEGIASGDQIVINPAEEPMQGSVALVSLYGMLSLKIIYRLGGGVICLRSDYGDQRLTPEEQDAAEFAVRGVLVSVIKPRPRPRPY